MTGTDLQREVMLVDLSAIARPIWEVSGSDADVDSCSRRIVTRVRALASDRPMVAICCDEGRSFRKDISAEYKGNRPEVDAAYYHQVKLARETLASDGFPIWAVKGFEADDLIASAVSTLDKGTAITFGKEVEFDEEIPVLIVSSDKDLLQLVGPTVRQQSVRDGSISGPEEVFAKFGVQPDQMRDWLCLVGDAADNIKGAKGIGVVTATELLSAHGSLDAIYAKKTGDGWPLVLGIKGAVASSLLAFEPRLREVRSLITLADSVALPIGELGARRVPKQSEESTFDYPEEEDMQPAGEVAADLFADAPPPQPPNGTLTLPLDQVSPKPEPKPTPATEKAAPKSEALEVRVARELEVVQPEVEFERQLEPRTVTQAVFIAKQMFEARLFSAYGNPAAVLSTIMAGRELGLQSMASMRAFHIVEGKPTPAADLLRALVLKSGKAKYFRCTQRTNESATFETQRGEDPPVSVTFTVEDGKRQAGGSFKPGSNWVKSPADQCVARSSAKLARLVYPDVTHGMYCSEELED